MDDAKMEDVVSVMRGMGYKVVEARKRASAACAQLGQDADLEALIKAALHASVAEALSAPPRPASTATVEPECRGGGNPYRGGGQIQRVPRPQQQPKRQKQRMARREVEEDLVEESSGGGFKTILLIAALLTGAYFFLGVAQVILIVVLVLVILYRIGKRNAVREEQE